MTSPSTDPTASARDSGASELARAWEEAGVAPRRAISIRVDLALTALGWAFLTASGGALTLGTLTLPDRLLCVLPVVTLPVGAVAALSAVVTARFLRRAVAISRLLDGSPADVACAHRALLETEREAWDPRTQIGLLAPVLWLAALAAASVFAGLVAGGIPLTHIAASVGVCVGTCVLGGAWGWVRVRRIRARVAALEQLEDRLRMRQLAG